MPKREKLPEIISGLPDDRGKLNGCMSDPLLNLSRSDLRLTELKLLCAYLARIDPTNPNRRTVKLSRKDVMEILGMTAIKSESIDAHLDRLFSSVKLENTDERKHGITLFEEYCAEKVGNQWEITLTCTMAAMRFFFNIEDLHYLRFKLECVVNLVTSRTFWLFMNLEKRRKMGEWTVTVEDLRKLLACDDGMYTEFKYLNERVIKAAQTELAAKSNYHFTYETIKRGRFVESIRFYIPPLILPKQTPTATESGQTAIDGNTGLRSHIPADVKDADIDRIIDAVTEKYTADSERVKAIDYAVKQADAHGAKHRGPYILKVIAESDVRKTAAKKVSAVKVRKPRELDSDEAAAILRMMQEDK